MKKILLVITLLVSTFAYADYREYRHHGPREVVRVERVSSGGEILVPLIIGGIFGAAIANQNQPQPQPIVVQPPPQPPIYVQREPVVVQQPQTVCYGWKEIQTPDGQIYRERSCYLR